MHARNPVPPRARSTTSRYRENPYHNFQHALEVAQAAFALLINSTVYGKIDPVNKLGMLLAAIGHDIDHPGGDS